MFDVHNGTSYNNLYLIAFGTTGTIKIKRQEMGDAYSAIRYSLSWFPAFVKHVWHFYLGTSSMIGKLTGC